jgi:carbon monoxide dehydrogenase subunit G
MELTSTRTVPASLETTWAALNDPEMLKACLPGCEAFERSGDNEFQSSMRVRVGPVNARFSGRIRLSDIVPPRSYTMTFEGQGGVAGFARGEARVALEAQDDGTRLEYKVKAQVGGKLAQIGSRLIDGAAAKVADDFFARLVAQLTVAEAEVRSRRIWIRLAIAAAIIVAMAVYWLTRAA